MVELRFVRRRLRLVAAATGGDTEIEEIVAVTESGDIVSPCGMCRELISDYSPDARVLLCVQGKAEAVLMADLFPEQVLLLSP